MKVKFGPHPKKGNRRKIEVNIDKYDTWSLDHTLALIIYPALIQLKETKQGVPNEFVEMVGGEDYSEQQSFDFYKETHHESWEIASRKWDEVLDKMIWSFHQLIIDDWSEQYHHGKSKYDWVENDKLFKNPITGNLEKTFQMVDLNPDEHFYDAEGHLLHQQRMQEGFELFGKYFLALWD